MADLAAVLATIACFATAAAAAATPDVAVLPPSPPTDQELAGDSLPQFIAHHATTHFANLPTARNLARWRGGRQSICPHTVGIVPADDAFVTARIRALAAYVGAPLQADPACKANVQIRFTNNPEAAMQDVVDWATVYFRNRYSGGTKDLLAFRGDHAIQGWYLATSGGSQALNTDLAFLGLDVLPVWPQVTQNYAGRGVGSGSGIGIGAVILVVDTKAVLDYTIGAVADYLAMLTFSVAQSPDHCDPLPSILDLMSADCRARGAPAAITAGDLAFLKALYYRNTGLGPSLSRADIQDNMLRQFNRR
jgi:hypothetical protein